MSNEQNLETFLEYEMHMRKDISTMMLRALNLLDFLAKNVRTPEILIGALWSIADSLDVAANENPPGLDYNMMNDWYNTIQANLDTGSTPSISADAEVCD